MNINVPSILNFFCLFYKQSSKSQTTVKVTGPLNIVSSHFMDIK